MGLEEESDGESFGFHLGVLGKVWWWRKCGRIKKKVFIFGRNFSIFTFRFYFP